MALGPLARSRALLASNQDAERFYTEAIDRLPGLPGSLHLARTRLLYGEWPRRRKRRSEARQQPRAAYTRFGKIGAAGFAERARLELIATGETARKRSPATRNELTPQETCRVWGVWADEVRERAEQRLGTGPGDPQVCCDPEYAQALDAGRPFTETARAAAVTGARDRKTENRVLTTKRTTYQRAERQPAEPASGSVKLSLGPQAPSLGRRGLPVTARPVWPAR